MENREILVANTKTQRRYKVTTNATTLGELKEALRNNDNIVMKSGNNWVPNTESIDFEDLTFTEGITHTQLLDDASQLPQNVMYQGNVTNSLVILLTNTKRKQALGGESRQKAYEIIKENGYQSAIREEYGVNYTNLSTDTLWAFITEQDDETEEDFTDEENDLDNDVNEMVSPRTPETKIDFFNLVYDLVKSLAKVEQLSVEDLYNLAELIGDLAGCLEEGKGGTDTQVGNIVVTPEELNEMISKL